MSEQPVWVDCETTALSPEAGCIWEIAILADGNEHVWRPAHDLDFAESGALRVGRYYERRRAAKHWGEHDPAMVAQVVAEVTAGRVLGGACPWFDARFLEVFLREHGECAAWSHRLLDVEAFAAGALGLDVPLGLSATAGKLGVAIPEEGRHTALGDARVAREVYRAALALGGPEKATGAVP